MKEITGNIWEQKADWICITTNGIIRNDGKAVMGRGIALQAKLKFSGIDSILAEKLKTNGNVVSLLKTEDNQKIFSFPTKNDWRDSSLALIEKSAEQLRELFLKEEVKPVVLLPRPGCSNGGRNWEKEVKPILEKILVEDNFVVCDFAK